MGKTARYREKPCKHCGQTHRNQGVYCSGRCRNQARTGQLPEEWREAISNGVRKHRLANPNENIMYALLNNLKKQKNPHHDPEAELIIGFTHLDNTDPPGELLDNTVWHTID